VLHGLANIEAALAEERKVRACAQHSLGQYGNIVMAFGFCHTFPQAMAQAELGQTLLYTVRHPVRFYLCM
jgi:hypothetical protein